MQYDSRYMNHDAIGEQIRYLRQKCGLTQQELAKKIGVSWEMISRYERGVSSSLSKIDALSKALNSDPIELLQKSYNPNTLGENVSVKIPLFTERPAWLTFTKNHTHYYYSAPEWILKHDPDSFMVDINILKIKTVQLKDNGPIYVSPNSAADENDIVFYSDKGELEVDIKSNAPTTAEIIGVVLAQENRYR